MTSSILSGRFTRSSIRLCALLLASIAPAVSLTCCAQSAPVINSFTAVGGYTGSTYSCILSWNTTGTTGISIAPLGLTSRSAIGTVSIATAMTPVYTLTATNSAGSATATATVLPVINSFSASPGSITSGSSATLAFQTTNVTSLSITPGSFTTSSPGGTFAVKPTATTTYTVTAVNSLGSATATTTVTVTAPASPLAISTTSCPTGTQNTAYPGCTIAATGGTPPYTFSVDNNGKYPPLPEGMSIDPSTGAIAAPILGGQGTYIPEIVVTDSTGAQADKLIAFSLIGSNAFMARIFPANSIFHHRVDAATTGLPVDSSPAAAIYSGYQPTMIRPFFGNAAYDGFPNGIPAIEVPYNQPDVDVSTTKYQPYFASGPIPPYAPVEGTSYSSGDRHVLVYVDPGPESNPALYEMWEGVSEEGPWTDSSNALWANVAANNLTTDGEGTTDAAGLPVAPLLLNADEVIGTGTPAAPNGTVRHPVRFTLNHMLNYWVWPARATAGVGYCTASSGSSIPVWAEISQATPPASCNFSAPAGEIYRLKASVATPACAAASPQAAVIIQGFRNYGIILADNGMTGGLIGTPDARWNDSDLSCLRKLTLSDFEPVNVSSLMVSEASGQTGR